jgi:hypothetical protein
LKALEEAQPPTIEPPEFRVYYDSNGAIRFYTMDKPPGAYLVITPEEYALGRYDLRVKNGELFQPAPSTSKYVVSEEPTRFKTVPGNILILTKDGPGTYWKVKEYHNDD